MGKYTREQLREMACIALKAKAIGDERYFQLVMALAVHRGTTAAEVEQSIVELAL